MTDEERKEWVACVSASHKAGLILMDSTDGPRQGIIAACMLLITISDTCEVDRDKVVSMLLSMWKMYQAEAEGPIQ